MYDLYMPSDSDLWRLVCVEGWIHDSGLKLQVELKLLPESANFTCLQFCLFFWLFNRLLIIHNIFLLGDTGSQGPEGPQGPKGIVLT